MKLYQFLLILGTLVMILSNVTESNYAEISYSISGLVLIVWGAALSFKEIK